MVQKTKGNILLGASYSAIEPLGIIYLGGLARDEGYNRFYELIKSTDDDLHFEKFKERIDDLNPQLSNPLKIGVNIYTGNHRQLFAFYDELKKEYGDRVETIIGGPHATYFPEEASHHADYVVMSEGFNSLRKVLRGEAKKGILPMEEKMRFPHPDRIRFYEESPYHKASPIKSFISMTGCPYKCTYCYNSSSPEDIAAPPEIIKRVKAGLELPILNQQKSSCDDGGCSSPVSKEADAKLNKLGYGRLFPFNVRPVDDVIKEGRELMEISPETVQLYSQDDVFGFDIKTWLPEFAERWPKEVGIPFHAQMRWEMTKDIERLDLAKKAGCNGLTLAIESANPVIRAEVLDRKMPEELMFKGMKALKERGLKVRTEQIMGLPYGATTMPTEMNLEADLLLVNLNRRLKEEAGGPDMSWGSTLVPYPGSKMGTYCNDYGFYSFNDNNIKNSFFLRSIMRFPKEWIGPSLKERKNDPGVWLSEDKLEQYREQNRELRDHFGFFTEVPKGDEFALRYLTSSEPFSRERLGKEAKEHLQKLAPNNERAAEILAVIKRIEKNVQNRTDAVEGLEALVPYLSVLPQPELAVERAIDYTHSKGNGVLSPNILSATVRHHMYDNALFPVNRATEDNLKYAKERNGNSKKNSFVRSSEQERYPPKI